MIRCVAFMLFLMHVLWASGSGSYFSTAGFYELANSGREVYSMNPAWRFLKGDTKNAQEINFDDSKWDVVSLPHGLELLPEEASGNLNYQGIAWYRKQFVADQKFRGKKIFLHFEGIMGKSQIWLNGKLITEHLDGYLPAVVDITNFLQWDTPNVLAVKADNSDDPLIPPGKPQRALDFTYFGGIYRDCFLVVHHSVFVTDPNYENETSGGGLFIYYPKVSAASAEMGLKLHIRNDSKKLFKGFVSFRLKNNKGEVVASYKKPLAIKEASASYIHSKMNINQPELWSPETPYLYDLEVTILDHQKKVVDGFIQKTGIKKLENKGVNGFWLNGKLVDEKLVGVNRHQEFAVIGNAVPNSLHWRDAKKLRDAGIRVIRCTQYPHDPAFLDACDQLGIFVIEAVAGWQFWNNDPVFAKRVYKHIRQMVRRDRNHASVFLWEPVLNETNFPYEYAKQAKACVDEEFPFNESLTACDPGSKGSELYPVVFTHPQSVTKGQSSVYNAGKSDPKKLYFTREFGDNVDDWNSHNSNSRVHRSWGECPMLEQALHYAHPSYNYTCLEALYSSDKQHLGGTLWHAFDHQRGYHPQPFYGGIMDAYRQPKTSYYMFMSQRPATKNKNLPAETGPMVYVANEMTPFSPKDVTVYSNCEEVRLTVYQGGKTFTYKRSSSDLKMPSPIITFKDAYHFMELKALSRAGKQNEVYILAEGLIDGKVVASHKRVPARRPSKLRLHVDDNGFKMQADGSDVMVVVAEIVDDNGNVKRLSNGSIKFTVTGEGHILGNNATNTNPSPAHWGSAPILVQATDKAGKIKVRAEIFGEGVHTIAPGEIVFESVFSNTKLLYNKSLLETKYQIESKPQSFTKESNSEEVNSLKGEINLLRKKISEYELKEVERQQDDFGEKR